jgi:predicted dehydrogenase
VSGRGGAAIAASETKPAASAGSARPIAGTAAGVDRSDALEEEIARFCAAVRLGQPVACGPERAMSSARACIAATEAADTHTRVTL